MGFKFNWCYVVEAVRLTAYSDEVKGAKVLVGCNIPSPVLKACLTTREGVPNHK